MKRTLLALAILFSISSYSAERNICVQASDAISQYSFSLGRIRTFMEAMESEDGITSPQLYQLIEEIGLDPSVSSYDEATALADILSKGIAILYAKDVIANECTVKKVVEEETVVEDAVVVEEETVVEDAVVVEEETVVEDGTPVN